VLAVEIPPVKSVRELRNHRGETKGTTFLAALPALTTPSPQKKKAKRYNATFCLLIDIGSVVILS
jgi:hypothetical protein